MHARAGEEKLPAPQIGPVNFHKMAPRPGGAVNIAGTSDARALEFGRMSPAPVKYLACRQHARLGALYQPQHTLTAWAFIRSDFVTLGHRFAGNQNPRLSHIVQRGTSQY